MAAVFLLGVAIVDGHAASAAQASADQIEFHHHASKPAGHQRPLHIHAMDTQHPPRDKMVFAAALHRRPVLLAHGFAPAPVPNLDIAEPNPTQDRSLRLRPAIFQLTNQFLGDGYVYGSSPQEMDDKRAARIPGVNVSVLFP